MTCACRHRFSVSTERLIGNLMDREDTNRALGTRCRSCHCRRRSGELNRCRAFIDYYPQPGTTIGKPISQCCPDFRPGSLGRLRANLAHESAEARQINCVQGAIGRLSPKQSLARPIGSAVGGDAHCGCQIIPAQPCVPSGHIASFSVRFLP